MRTTYGSAVFSEHVPAATAEALRSLEAAGYANVGKANLHEFAYGTTSQNLHYGTVPNPAAPGRTSGGSSGGSAAALAAGLAEAALGTDTGGSIRIPAACCGIVGFKPSYGLVSLDGVFPLAPSFDHAGPMARDVRGCVEMMEALVPGFSAGGRRSRSFESEPPGSRTPTRSSRRGSKKRRPTSATGSPWASQRRNRSSRSSCARSATFIASSIRSTPSSTARTSRRRSSAAWRCATAKRPRPLRQGGLPGEALAAIEPFDLLLAPTLAFVAPPADVDEIAVRGSFVRFTFPFNVLGWPALALPCGAAEGGLPASIQIVGRPGEDERVLAAGLALEAALA